MNHDNLKLGRIMIVDDEAELMTALCESLAAQGYEANGFTNGADALKVLAEQDYDLLLTDLMMPEMDGIALLKSGLEIDPNLICIIMTGHGTVQTAVEAMQKGAFDYILKPFKLNTLMPLLSRAMEVRSLRMDNIQLKETVAIHELGKAIAFSTDLNAILNKVADATLQQYNADEVSIMLPTSGDKELYVAVARGGHKEYIGERVPMEKGIAGWVARNRETVIMNGKVDDPRFSPVNPRSDIRAAISMPMMAGGKLVGVLNINVTKSHRRITLGQVKALGILVSIISPILENTWLNIRVREAEERYRSIFENSSEGIYQSTPEGRFKLANRSFARMLGYDSPEELISAVTDIASQVYVNQEERDNVFQLIKDEGLVKSYETRFYRKDGQIIWVSMSMRAVNDEKGNLRYYEGIEKDITERKLAESQWILTSRILETLNRPNEIVNLIHDILLLLKEHTGIEALGVRLREGDDFPYYLTNGFTNDFVEAENYLCARDNAGEIIHDSQGNRYLVGRCGNVLCGRIDASLPFFTEGGSFWTNSTTKHLAEISGEKEDQCNIRNRCNSEGYESIALIPLKSGDNIIGLLQLNDSRRDLFTIEMIKFLEGIGASIGIAVARKRSLEALQENEKKYRLLADNVNDVIFILDMNLNYTYISPSVKYLRGYEPAEVLKQKPTETLTQSSWDLAMRTLSEVIELEKSEHSEKPISRMLQLEMRRKDGTTVWTEVQLSFIRDENHQSMGILGVTRDITDRKQAEEWLLRERSMVDRIMKTSPAGIAVVDRKGQIVFSNKRAEEIFCLTKNEITQRSYSASEWHITDFDGNPFPEEQLPFTRVINTANPVYGVRHTILTGGQRVFLSINGAPIFDDSGHVSEVIFTIDDVTQFRQAEEKIEKSVKQLEKSMEDTIKAMSMIVETRDPYTAGHQGRATRLSLAIAEKLNLSESRIKSILMAGSIHDIGKIYIPAEILSKPGRLSENEMEFVRTHAQKGYDIMKDIDFPWPVARIILEHHERMDGSGYPNGKSNNEILLESRIIAVADVVEAMASHRPYRPALGIDTALGEIEKNKGVLYDPDAVDVCLKLFREEGFQLEGA